MKNPKVSVLIDTYNYGRYIQDAVDSVLNQDFPGSEVEIIVIDDGSTDDTPEKIARYGDKIQYFVKPNGGQASAFNFGFERAHGEIIAFLDSDDTWGQDKLKLVVREFERCQQVDVVYHYMTLVDRELNAIEQPFLDFKQEVERFDEFPMKSYLKGEIPFGLVFCVTSGIAVRAKCLKKIMPIPEEFRRAADIYLRGLLPLRARRFALVSNYLGNYRCHETNSLGIGKERELAIDLEFYPLLLRALEKETRELGFDGAILKMKIESLMEWKKIVLAGRRGKKLKALKGALLLKEVPTPRNFFRFILRKLFRAGDILLPPSCFARLESRYKASFLFKILMRPSQENESGVWKEKNHI